MQRFHSMADTWRNPDVPRLNAWVVKQGIGQGTGNQIIAERNPYYFKVDTEGNQLPYIDRATIDIISDAQVTTLKAANGDFDMVDSYVGFVTTPENKGTFFDNAEAGGYDFYEVLPNRANLMIISLNMTHKDPVMRELFQNKTFRQALSTAINRDEVIELVWLGQGRPYQVVERPESPLFDEEMATQFTTFDIAKANEMLDGIGLTEKDAERHPPAVGRPAAALHYRHLGDPPAVDRLGRADQGLLEADRRRPPDQHLRHDRPEPAGRGERPRRRGLVRVGRGRHALRPEVLLPLVLGRLLRHDLGPVVRRRRQPRGAARGGARSRWSSSASCSARPTPKAGWS